MPSQSHCVGCTSSVLSLLPTPAPRDANAEKSSGRSLADWSESGELPLQLHEPVVLQGTHHDLGQAPGALGKLIAQPLTKHDHAPNELETVYQVALGQDNLQLRRRPLESGIWWRHCRVLVVEQRREGHSQLATLPSAKRAHQGTNQPIPTKLTGN